MYLCGIEHRQDDRSVEGRVVGRVLAFSYKWCIHNAAQLCLPGTNGRDDSFKLYVLLCVDVAVAVVDCICHRSGAHNPQIRECARNMTYWATHS